MKKLTGLMMAMALAGCASVEGTTVGYADHNSPIALDRLLGFSDPSRCEPNATQTQLLGRLSIPGGDEDGVGDDAIQLGKLVAPAWARPAFGVPERRRFDGWTVIHLPVVAGTLLGLPLVAIDQSFPDGGDPGDVSYSFAMSASRAEEHLRARGFPAKVGQDTALSPDNGYTHQMSLHADPDDPTRAILSCGYY